MTPRGKVLSRFALDYKNKAPQRILAECVHVSLQGGVIPKAAGIKSKKNKVGVLSERKHFERSSSCVT